LAQLDQKLLARPSLGVGTGNDFWGWEFHRETKAAFGTIVIEEMRWENPSPTRMFWRPDKMIIKYELTNPYLDGVFDGWCSDWEQGSENGDSFWGNLWEEECWDHCKKDSSCFQAVYESEPDGTQRWIGLNKMTEGPGGNRCPECVDRCFAKAKPEIILIIG
jgi:hypothetical protein